MVRVRLRKLTPCFALTVAGLGCDEGQPALSSGEITLGNVNVPYMVEGQGIPTLVTCDALALIMAGGARHA
jgi:hypothetical protein